MNICIRDLQDKYLNKEVKVRDFVEATYERIKANDLNTYISLNKDQALKDASRIDEKIEAGEALGRLFGVTFAIKDNISTKGLRTTCGSKMLESYVPVFDASVVEKIREEDGIIIGKVNMDEFAMGASGETSYFGPTKNPLDPTRIPGGSSSGSAASVKGGECLVALGTDTGGSVRHPAAFCNVYGYYPSYGTISRYGVVPMANTLDQVGILANSVKDIAEVLNIIGGKDEKDPNTSQDFGEINLEGYLLENKKIAVLKSLDQLHVDPQVRKEYDRVLEQLKGLGAEIEEIDMDMLAYANAIYNVLMNVEVSSNMSRFDGIRYGHVSNQPAKSLEEFYMLNRTEGFGKEVKKRIAMGFLLTGRDHKGQRYEKALKARRMLRDEVEEIFKTFDFILTPTTTSLPTKIGERSQDPLQSFDSGAFNVMTNLTSTCAISMPTSEGVSVGVQLMAARKRDRDLLAAAHQFEINRD